MRGEEIRRAFFALIKRSNLWRVVKGARQPRSAAAISSA